MTSLRTQLLVWLLPGFVLVVIAAGVGLYFSARHSFETDLDARLGKLAGTARLALQNQTGGVANGPRGLTLRAFIARELGPMKRMLQFSHTSAKCAFSERKP